MLQKSFSVQCGIGKAKYVVSYHDGVKTHKDGSPFFDAAIFKSRKKLRIFMGELLSGGFVER